MERADLPANPRIIVPVAAGVSVPILGIPALVFPGGASGRLAAVVSVAAFAAAVVAVAFAAALSAPVVVACLSLLSVVQVKIPGLLVAVVSVVPVAAVGVSAPFLALLALIFPVGYFSLLAFFLAVAVDFAAVAVACL